jgi:hypothetical protein
VRPRRVFSSSFQSTYSLFVHFPSRYSRAMRQTAQFGFRSQVNSDSPFNVPTGTKTCSRHNATDCSSFKHTAFSRMSLFGLRCSHSHNVLPSSCTQHTGSPRTRRAGATCIDVLVRHQRAFPRAAHSVCERMLRSRRGRLQPTAAAVRRDDGSSSPAACITAFSAAEALRITHIYL